MIALTHVGLPNWFICASLPSMRYTVKAWDISEWNPRCGHIFIWLTYSGLWRLFDLWFKKGQYCQAHLNNPMGIQKYVNLSNLLISVQACLLAHSILLVYRYVLHLSLMWSQDGFAVSHFVFDFVFSVVSRRLHLMHVMQPFINMSATFIPDVNFFSSMLIMI